jgi:hypothetical protein
MATESKLEVSQIWDTGRNEAMTAIRYGISFEMIIVF